MNVSNLQLQTQCNRFRLIQNFFCCCISVTWNEASVKAAWDGSAVADGNAYTILAASKTQGERAAWDWIRANKPGYEFNAVLPNFTVSARLVFD